MSTCGLKRDLHVLSGDRTSSLASLSHPHPAEPHDTHIVSVACSEPPCWTFMQLTTGKNTGFESPKLSNKEGGWIVNRKGSAGV